MDPETTELKENNEPTPVSDITDSEIKHEVPDSTLRRKNLDSFFGESDHCANKVYQSEVSFLLIFFFLYQKFNVATVKINFFMSVKVADITLLSYFF